MLPLVVSIFLIWQGPFNTTPLATFTITFIAQVGQNILCNRHHSTLQRVCASLLRILDRKRNVLVYLTYSDKLIDGSPQNGVTAVALGSVPMPPQ